MWTCKKCGEQVEDNFDSCWKCSAPRDAAPAPAEVAATAAPKWRVAHRIFRGTFISWEELFDQAAAFANEIGPERLVNVSHSADRGDGVVVVWYLTAECEKPAGD